MDVAHFWATRIDFSDDISKCTQSFYYQFNKIIDLYEVSDKFFKKRYNVAKIDFKKNLWVVFSSFPYLH